MEINYDKSADEDRPIEFYIAHSIDPYTSEEERRLYTQTLCEKIINDVEGPQIASKFFSHKITSPDPSEALNALNVVDYCLRICGHRLAIDIGKFRFLNSFIRILSTKYLGNETDSNVKEKATHLLYGWQKYIEHIGKFKEVYELLKKQKIILADPIIKVEDYVIEKKRPEKMAAFEDEEKSKLLSSLLSSKNANDLQAANRLIKSLVRTEDKKMEQRMKRVEEIETARKFTCIIIELLNNYTANVTTPEECRTIGSLFNKVYHMQPRISSFANDTLEGEEELLLELLELNDDMNKSIQMYQELFKPVVTKSSFHRTFSAEAKRVTWKDESEGSSLDTVMDDEDDVILSLWSRQNTPQLPRKKMIMNENKIDDLMDIFDEQSTSKSNRSTKEMDLLCDDFQDISVLPVVPVQFELKPQLEHDGVSLFLENLIIPIADLEFVNRPPITMHDENMVKVILYFSKPKTTPRFKNVLTLLATISNFNTITLNNIKLNLRAETKLIMNKLDPATTNVLQAFNPLNAVESIKQVYYIFPLSDMIELAEVNFTLEYNLTKYHTISGKFDLMLKDFNLQK
uniref:VHS domain-containing protein n=1 Tax=Rhabditophanes sp. KR3021 TaxID=114890 RepID=A0AC35U8J5_9BILA